ncbi:MAG: magnesium transporter CorA [Burkholderiales bacterium]|nr:magnesium transporter CorA [Burkholderiales bacterium]
MRVFHLGAERFAELPGLPDELPAAGFVWIGVARSVLDAHLVQVQAVLQRWCGATVVDLHVSDLLNQQLPSHYDYTSSYDMMVFRRLAAAGGARGGADELALPASGAGAAEAIDTSPVGFVVFDRVLLTVHSAECAVRDHFAQRLQALAASADGRGTARLPASPADLMLRMVNHMVDSYLDLRRLLTRQLGRQQHELLDPRSRFRDWHALLASRDLLHLLEDICEDQRSAVQEWIDALDEWPQEPDAAARRERELLRVRSRDVLEHIGRVLAHVRRLEESAEVAVQMHFSALGHRTNGIMRTLTVLTAVFLPLNLITGFFGMNFEALPWIHSATGVWATVGLMAAVVVALVLLFRRKRYLGEER